MPEIYFLLSLGGKLMKWMELSYLSPNIFNLWFNISM